MISFLTLNYVLFLFFTVMVLKFLIKNSLTNQLIQTNMTKISYITISLFIFVALVVNIFIYSSLVNSFSSSVNLIFENSSLKVYYFPFIYLMVLITLISVIFCLNYNYSELSTFLMYILVIFVSGMGLFFVNSTVIFFIFYEFLLVPSFMILYKYSKTRRAVEASYLMFFWTQFGAMFLIYVIVYLFLTTGSTTFYVMYTFNFTKFEINFIFIFLVIGFGVKLPIWPFYDWLPKAHVEASTNFSIFLSGVLVKFAFFGLMKFLISLNQDICFLFIFPYLLVGMVDSTLKAFYQIDIKKLIAFATVVEMHWLLLCVVSGQTILWLAGFAMLISHAIISTNSFLIVDSIARRYKTRLVNEISGICFNNPKLFLLSLVNLLVFLGFPGSLFFIAEFLFFGFLFDLFPLMSIITLFLVYFLLAVFYMKVWMNILFSSNNLKYKLTLDLDKTELLIFSSLVLFIFWLGFSWHTIVF